MEKLPCIDCLALPICKSLYRDCMNDTGRVFIKEVEHKCSLVRRVSRDTDYKERHHMIVSLYVFFYKGFCDD